MYSDRESNRRPLGSWAGPKRQWRLFSMAHHPGLAVRSSHPAPDCPVRSAVTSARPARSSRSCPHLLPASPGEQRAEERCVSACRPGAGPGTTRRPTRGPAPAKGLCFGAAWPVGCSGLTARGGWGAAAQAWLAGRPPFQLPERLASLCRPSRAAALPGLAC